VDHHRALRRQVAELLALVRDFGPDAVGAALAAALEHLADLELAARQQRSIDRRFRLARLYLMPAIAEFRFDHHKSRQQARQRILQLLELEFVRTGANVILIGNPGTGKTFLAKIIAWQNGLHPQAVFIFREWDEHRSIPDHQAASRFTPSSQGAQSRTGIRTTPSSPSAQRQSATQFPPARHAHGGGNSTRIDADCCG
jgi:ATPase subunit of ABC transporter with duplicated ATPase domains